MEEYRIMVPILRSPYRHEDINNEIHPEGGIRNVYKYPRRLMDLNS